MSLFLVSALLPGAEHLQGQCTVLFCLTRMTAHYIIMLLMDDNELMSVIRNNMLLDEVMLL